MSSVTAPTNQEQPFKVNVEVLFHEHHHFVFRTAYGITGTAVDAEDVVQTVFLRLLGNGISPDMEQNPKAYLYRAAVNRALDILQSQKRQRTFGPVACTTDADHTQQAETIHRKLYEAIGTLGAKAAEILILRYVHDASDAEIAKLLGTSRGAIAVNLYRSRARLKKILRASLEEER